ncbi:MAG: hypothetical protein EOM59_11665 [Clostridia bacterium]|nr:hypothetical protein [Clostridia bacterium]
MKYDDYISKVKASSPIAKCECEADDNAVEILIAIDRGKLTSRVNVNFYDVVDEAHKQGYRLELVKKEQP